MLSEILSLKNELDDLIDVNRLTETIKKIVFQHESQCKRLAEQNILISSFDQCKETYNASLQQQNEIIIRTNSRLKSSDARAIKAANELGELSEKVGMLELEIVKHTAKLNTMLDVNMNLESDNKKLLELLAEKDSVLVNSEKAQELLLEDREQLCNKVRNLETRLELILSINHKFASNSCEVGNTTRNQIDEINTNNHSVGSNTHQKDEHEHIRIIPKNLNGFVDVGFQSIDGSSFFKVEHENCLNTECSSSNSKSDKIEIDSGVSTPIKSSLENLDFDNFVFVNESSQMQSDSILLSDQSFFEIDVPEKLQNASCIETSNFDRVNNEELLGTDNKYPKLLSQIDKLQRTLRCAESEIEALELELHCSKQKIEQMESQAKEKFLANSEERAAWENSLNVSSNRIHFLTNQVWNYERILDSIDSKNASRCIATCQTDFESYQHLSFEANSCDGFDLSNNSNVSLTTSDNFIASSRAVCVCKFDFMSRSEHKITSAQHFNIGSPPPPQPSISSSSSHSMMMSKCHQRRIKDEYNSNNNINRNIINHFSNIILSDNGELISHDIPIDSDPSHSTLSSKVSSVLSLFSSSGSTEEQRSDDIEDRIFPPTALRELLHTVKERDDLAISSATTACSLPEIKKSDNFDIITGKLEKPEMNKQTDDINQQSTTQSTWFSWVSNLGEASSLFM